MEFREVAWRKALRSAEEGDGDAARRLLGHLAYYLKTGEPVPEPLAGFMATAAEAVATGASSAERAFKLTGPKRGRRPTTIAAQSLKYAVPATCSFLLEREGRNADYAIDETARSFAMSHREVERAREWFRGLFENPTQKSGPTSAKNRNKKGG